MGNRHEIDQHAGAVHRRDAAQIIRLFVVAAIVAALIVVAFDNRDDVRLGYAIGEASAPVWIVLVAAAISPLSVRPRRSGPGTHLEILLPQQVAVLYQDDQARLITHISSGTGEEC